MHQLRANATMSQNPPPVYSAEQQLTSERKNAAIAYLRPPRGNVGFAALSGMPEGSAKTGKGLLRGQGLLRGRGKKKAKRPTIGGKAKRAKRRGCKK